MVNLRVRSEFSVSVRISDSVPFCLVRDDVIVIAGIIGIIIAP